MTRPTGASASPGKDPLRNPSATSDGPPDQPEPAAGARTLREVLMHPGAVMAVRLAGTQLRRLHAQPLPPAAGCDIRGPRDEAQMLTTQLENVIWRAPAVYAAIGEEGRVALDELVALRTPPRRVIHGHLDLDQILLTNDGRAVIALPPCTTLGDPVIDLAGLTAHITAAVDPALATVLRRALLAGYGAPARWANRMATYEEAARLRLICAGVLLTCAAGPPAATRPRAGHARVRSMRPLMPGRVPAPR